MWLRMRRREWEDWIQSALDSGHGPDGSYFVDHERGEGQSSLHLILVHYRPARGTSKVIMPVGVMCKPVTLDYAADTVAQSITTTYRPESWMGRTVYFAVCDPFSQQISCYTIDEQDMLDQKRDVRVGEDTVLWAADQNRQLYGV